jgi:hypothetical protein
VSIGTVLSPELKDSKGEWHLRALKPRTPGPHPNQHTGPGLQGKSRAAGQLSVSVTDA